MLLLTYLTESKKPLEMNYSLTKHVKLSMVNKKSINQEGRNLLNL